MNFAYNNLQKLANNQDNYVSQRQFEVLAETIRKENKYYSDTEISKLTKFVNDTLDEKMKLLNNVPDAKYFVSK